MDSSKHRPVRRFRPVVFLISLVILALMLIGVYFLHSYRVGNLYSVFLSRADLLIADGKHEAAMEYLWLAKKIDGSDPDLNVKIAKTYDVAVGESPQCIDLHYVAIGLAPKNEAIRYRLAEMLLHQRRYVEASEQADLFLSTKADDVRALEIAAASEYALLENGRDPRAAVDILIRLLKVQPDSVENVLRLAVVRRGYLNQKTLGDETLDSFLENHEDLALAHLARYRYRIQFRLPGGPEDLQNAVKLSREPEILQAAALHEETLGESEKALEYYRELQRVEEYELLATEGIARVLAGQGDFKAAAKELKDSIGQKGSIRLRLELANILIDANDLAATESELGEAERELNQAKIPAEVATRLRAIVVFVKGRLHFARGNYLAAIGTLNPLKNSADQISGQASLVLGDAYFRIGMWEEAAKAYEVATRDLRVATKAHAQLALIHEQFGEMDKAKIALSALDGLQPNSPDSRRRHIQTLTRIQTSLPQQQRDFSEVEEAISASHQVLGEHEIELLNAELEIVKGQPEQALEIIESQEMFPEELQARKELISISALVQLDDKETALSRLANLPKTLSIAERLKAASLFERCDESQLAIDCLEAGLVVQDVESLRLLRGRMAILQIGINDLGSAITNLKFLAQIPDINAISELARIHRQQQDWKNAQHWEEKLRELEGNAGLKWRFLRGRRYLAMFDKTRQHKWLEECSRLISELQKDYPNSPQPYILAAEVCEFLEQQEAAIANYQAAIARKSEDAAVFQRLIALLCEAKRFDVADQYYRRFGSGASTSWMSTLGIVIASEKGDLDRALRASEQHTIDHPKDPMAHVWHAKMLSKAGRKTEAESALATAIRLVPGEIQYWRMLLVHHSFNGHYVKIPKVLKQIVSEANLQPGERAFLQAIGSGLLGKKTEAVQFAEAAANTIGDDTLLAQTITLMIQNDSPEKAIVYARRLASSKNSVDGKRLLVSALRSAGGEANLREAEEVLGKILPAGNVEDAVALYHVLSEQGRNEEAVEFILQRNSLSGQSNLLPEVIDSLIDSERLASAKVWIDMLQRVAPGETQTLRLRLKYTLATGSGVEEAIQQYLEKGVTTERLLRLANSCTELSLESTIEDKLRSLQPKSTVAFALWLSQRGRNEEALSLLRNAYESESVIEDELVSAFLTILLETNPASELVPPCTELLDQRLKSASRPDLLANAAVLDYRQGRNDRAEERLRKVLSVSPANFAVLSNLALVISEDASRVEEAEKLIDQAIAIDGPTPYLLLTKAIVLRRAGKLQDSIASIDQAMECPLPKGEFYFHLALAYQDQGLVDEAKRHLAESWANGLQRNELTRREISRADEISD